MGSFGRSIGAEKNRFNQAVVSLVGIVEGVLCDGNLNNDEIKFLDSWLDHNRQISSTWPGDAVYARVKDVLADGIITEDERNNLVTLLHDITGSNEPSVGETSVISLGFDEFVNVTLPERIFCFTGNFAYGPRGICEEATRRRGGAIHGSVIMQLDYLVVGGLGSPEWKNGSYGTKIEKAMGYKSKGAVIHCDTYGSLYGSTMWCTSLSG